MYSIESLKDKYNAEHDIAVDFAWIDYELLMLIESQQKRIEELKALVVGLNERLETLEGLTYSD